MWADGCRTKKLIVAFHFQFANQAAWKCETCRQSGLESRRRCGWLNVEVSEGTAPVIWARRSVAIESCPTSYITPESQALLEEFHVWKLFGAPDVYSLPARLVEALVLLENEWRAERINAQE